MIKVVIFSKFCRPVYCISERLKRQKGLKKVDTMLHYFHFVKTQKGSKKVDTMGTISVFFIFKKV